MARLALNLFFFPALISIIAFSSPSFAKLELKDIQAALESEDGLTAEIHGADKDSHLFVVVVRDPKNFFDYIQIPLVADYTSKNYEEVKKTLYTLNRHDFVNIKGSFHGWLDAAQRHIMVQTLTVVKRFDGGYSDYPDYKHNIKVPEELKNQSSAVVKVHAVVKGGSIFLVEYKDVNLPIVVERPELVENLYRGDKIRIHYEIAKFPSRPMHLKLKSEDGSIEMLDRLVDQHDQPIHHCGDLVMFPKSPQVIFNVFAIKKDLGDDLFRTYTLINFDDMDLFLAVREKAQAAWDQKTESITRGRNYYINSGIQACAKGRVHMIDPTQANPQIIIERVEDLYFK